MKKHFLYYKPYRKDQYLLWNRVDMKSHMTVGKSSRLRAGSAWLWVTVVVDCYVRYPWAQICTTKMLYKYLKTSSAVLVSSTSLSNLFTDGSKTTCFQWWNLFNSTVLKNPQDVRLILENKKVLDDIFCMQSNVFKFNTLYFALTSNAYIFIKAAISNFRHKRPNICLELLSTIVISLKNVIRACKRSFRYCSGVGWCTSRSKY